MALLRVAVIRLAAMRNPNFLLRLATVVVAIAIAACGPSSKELVGAKTAHYKGDKLAMFAAVKATVSEKYHIAKSDENALGMQTVGRWFTPEGLAAGERNDDMRDVPDKSLQIALVVTIQPDGDEYVVNVKPLMIRYIAGSPKPEPVAEHDPSVPGWASGKLDELALEIHSALAQYEVKTLPGSVPPAAPMPSSPATAPAP
ncbi:hypothetical protein BH11MYX1_BH11MYX1_30790 [soil metagenome]